MNAIILTSALLLAQLDPSLTGETSRQTATSGPRAPVESVGLPSHGELKLFYKCRYREPCVMSTKGPAEAYIDPSSIVKSKDRFTTWVYIFKGDNTLSKVNYKDGAAHKLTIRCQSINPLDNVTESLLLFKDGVIIKYVSSVKALNSEDARDSFSNLMRLRQRWGDGGFTYEASKFVCVNYS